MIAESHALTRQQRIEQQLTQHLTPAYLLVENESKNHNVPTGSETHFKVIAVSNHFENLSRIARHRLINQILAAELASGMHALSLHLYACEEWATAKENLQQSPQCLGGKAKNHD